MRITKIIVGILFVVSLGMGIGYFAYAKNNIDDTYPQITSDIDILEISTDTSEMDLLQGLTAYDEKDGDLTPHIMVGNISKFIEKGVSNVEYVVYDRDGHANKLTRKVRYTDYRSPEFTFTQELKFPAGKTVSILSYIQASDMLDGDITNKIRLVSSSLSTSAAGIYDITVQVTNSRGDTSAAQLKVEMSSTSSSAYSPKIQLSQYILYCDPQEQIDPLSYITEVTDAEGRTMDKNKVKIESDLDTSEPGIYFINYSIPDEERPTFIGTTRLAVVVREL